MKVKCINTFSNSRFDPIEQGKIYFVFTTKVGFAGLGWKTNSTKIFLCRKEGFKKGDIPRGGILMEIRIFWKQILSGNLKIIL
jgi:hypothetical protein